MGKDNDWEKQEGLGIWFPAEKDDELVGEVMSINTEAQYGVQYLVKKDNGDEVNTPSHKVLQNRLAKVKVGDMVKIVYKGTEPPKVKGQNPTEMYEVFRKEK